MIATLGLLCLALWLVSATSDQRPVSFNGDESSTTMAADMALLMEQRRAASCDFICGELLLPPDFSENEGPLPSVVPLSEKCHFTETPPESKSPQELANTPRDQWDNLVLNKVRSSRLPDTGEYRPTLLCLTYTVAAQHAKSASMYNEWGSPSRRNGCDRHLLFTDKPPIDGVPPSDVVEIHPRKGGESYNNMWQKILAIRRYVIQEWWWTGQYDYIFMSGDDALLHVPNIRRYVSEPQVRYLHESGAPIHVGYRHTPLTHTPFLSGAGTLMNQAALHTWDVTEREPACRPDEEMFAEDVFTSECFGESGIESTDARDEFGHDRFNIFPPDYAIGQALSPHTTQWFVDYRDRPHPKGLDTVSRDSVMWHYVQPDRMSSFCARFRRQTEAAAAEMRALRRKG